jgi:erythromycin esterase-like protein/beta-lactamase regulating signal transducer with metallopeptidase domain
MNAVLAALANALVLGGLLTLAVAVVLRVLPKQTLNAATRYLVWWVTLALVILSPCFYLPVGPASSLNRPPQSGLYAPSPGLAPSVGVQESTPDPSSPGDRPSSVAPAGNSTRPATVSAFPVRLGAGALAGLLLLTLLFASALAAARIMVTSLILESRKRRALPAPARLEGRVKEWLSHCGSKRRGVRLLGSSEISIPMAVGPHRPAILIPASLFDQLTDCEMNNIGLHEAAHLARRDDYALFLQRLIEAIFVWNPFVRWITGRIDLEREMACDDLVVAITGEPREYATCLTNMAELSGRVGRSLVAAGATQEGKLLERRVETLLDRSRQRGTKVLRLRLAPLVFVQLALVFWATTAPGVAIFAGPSVQDGASAAIEQAIAAQGIRLETVEAGHGFADMQPLKDLVGNARIVALGEATHGTREFFQLKHRMLEFLATEMGFNIFSIEANLPEAYRVNDYVLKGQGDPKQLLKGMYFWTWDTEEVLDMILWIREFNKSGKGRVEFTGFDMQTPDVALQIVDNFVARYDPEYLTDLRPASTLAKSAAAQRMGSGAGFGVATATFPVQQAAGKRVRYTGYIKTSAVTRGYAGLWWRVDGKAGQMLAFDNMHNRGPKGTTDWQRYEIDLPVAAEAVNINFGALHTGDGTAWFDGLTVELDGSPYLDGNDFDLDFESAGPKGFYTGGTGYQVFLDRQTFRSGSQSLQMRYFGGTRQPDDGRAAREAWKRIQSHLEQSDERYQVRGVPAREVQWAVQNARVVLQCLQMVGNEVSRDASMAANVKWILDQSPAAKIVLWAHNGHVSRAHLGYEPMGSCLSRMYGDQMVVFGFAFNQGSFQAIKMSSGLQDFTVGPAPPGSLDATLAAAGIPILALDVRQAPAGSPLRAWLSQPHTTRSIGAVYSEDSADNYLANVVVRDWYDALLFVEKTTAARKNAANEAPIFAPAAPRVEAEAQKAGGQEYRDEETGVSFILPEGLSTQQDLRWGDQETTVWLQDRESKRFGALYFRIYQIPQATSTDAIRQRLQDEVEKKVAQRVNQGTPDYRIEAETCRARNIGGRLALSCRGEFTEGGQIMGEYLTWVGSENTLALFFGRALAPDFDRYCAQFDVVIETLKIP